MGLVIGIGGVIGATGGVLTVSTTGDVGPGSLRSAMLAAAAADGPSVITIATTGVISLSSPLPSVTKSTTILGPGARLLTVSGSNAVPLFALRAGTTNMIAGLTLADGFGDTNWNGSAISNAGVLVIRDCVVLNNQSVAGSGGAIYSEGELTILGTRFQDNISRRMTTNIADSGGGALYATNCTVLLTNCDFVGNRAFGLIPADCWPSINQGVSTGTARGGAIHLGAVVFIADGVRIRDSLAIGGSGILGKSCLRASGDAFGGGVFAIRSTLRMVSSDIRSNLVYGGQAGGTSPYYTGGTGKGGGIYAVSSDCDLSGSTVVGNAASCGIPSSGQQAKGGGVYLEDSRLSLARSEIFENAANGERLITGGRPEVMNDGMGGGLFAIGSSIAIYDSAGVSNRAVGAGPTRALMGPAIAGGMAYGGFAYLSRCGVVISNSCVAGNVALGGEGAYYLDLPSNYGPGGNSYGGALFAVDSFVTNHSVTMASNAALAGPFGGASFGVTNGTNGLGIGGGFYCSNTVIVLRESIVAANHAATTAGEGVGEVNSGGWNLVGDLTGTAGWNANDLQQRNPKLGPVRRNGGSTLNLALLCGSPAIDAGPSGNGPTSDQRGVVRPQGAARDIGSFEYVDAGEPPTVEVGPARQRLVAGESATLWASPEGYGDFHYQWLKDGTNVPGANGQELRLAAASTGDQGSYRVLVTDCFGMVTSSVARIEVQYVSVFVGGEILLGDRYQFDGPVLVELRSVFPGGLIFYTLDGSAPGIDSSLYSGPFSLGQNGRLRAIGYSWDFFESGQSTPIEFELAAVYTFNAFSDGGGAVDWSPRQDRYIAGSPVVVTARPNPGWRFLGWLGDVAGVPNQATATVNVSRNRCLQAVFGTTLQITVAGNGVVRGDPKADWYPYGAQVSIHGLPGSNSYFGFWGGAASGTNNPFSLSVTSAEPSVSSIFGILGSNQVSLSVSPQGKGAFTVEPYATRYQRGVTVTIRAVPAEGQQFLRWEGDLAGALNPATVSMDRSKSVVPVFTRKPWFSEPGCLSGWSLEGYWGTLSGEPGTQYGIEYSTNGFRWDQLTVVSNVFGRVSFDDPDAGTLPSRVYRAIERP